MLSTAELRSRLPTLNSDFGNHLWPRWFYQTVGNKQENEASIQLLSLRLLGNMQPAKKQVRLAKLSHAWGCISLV